MDNLNARINVIDWDVFVKNTKDVDAVVNTVSEYIKFNVDMLAPKKTAKIICKQQTLDKQFIKEANSG